MKPFDRGGTNANDRSRYDISDNVKQENGEETRREENTFDSSMDGWTAAGNHSWTRFLSFSSTSLVKLAEDCCSRQMNSKPLVFFQNPPVNRLLGSMKRLWCAIIIIVDP